MRANLDFVKRSDNMNVIKWLLSDPWLLVILICILIMPKWYMECMHIDDSIVRYLSKRRGKNG